MCVSLSLSLLPSLTFLSCEYQARWVLLVCLLLSLVHSFFTQCFCVKVPLSILVLSSLPLSCLSSWGCSCQPSLQGFTLGIVMQPVSQALGLSVSLLLCLHLLFFLYIYEGHVAYGSELVHSDWCGHSDMCVGANKEEMPVGLCTRSKATVRAAGTGCTTLSVCRPSA